MLISECVNSPLTKKWSGVKFAFI